MLEDNPIDAEIVTTTLKNSHIDFSATLVDNRADFIAAMEREHVDLVLADYSLPDFDGLSAIALVQSYDPEIPCILVSGVLGEERAIEALKSGATDYVLKGRLERLEPALTRAIQEREERLRFQATADALQQSEERFRTSVEAMVDCLAILSAKRSPNGEIKDFMVGYLNAAACEYLSVAPKEYVGKPLYAVIPGFENTIRNSLFYSFCFTVDNGKPFQEEIFLYPQGTPLSQGSSLDPDALPQQFVALEMKANKLKDGIVVTWRDITLQKQVERQRVQLVRAAERARNQAESANHFKDEFIATLSHELRTPLNAIDGWIQLANKGQAKPNMMQKAFGIIRRNTAMLERIINDILDVSRINQGKLTVDIQPIATAEFQHLIESTIETISPTAAEKQIEITYSFDPNLQSSEALQSKSKSDYVAGDIARLQQVVWNLLSNAIKFTPRRGAVSVTTQKQKKSVVLLVEDNGSGIAPEHLPRIFERFQQAGKSSNKSYNGLGLGLSIVQHIVESHGGEIEAQSDGIDQGSLFKVSLPLRASTEISDIQKLSASLSKSVESQPVSEQSVSEKSVSEGSVAEQSLAEQSLAEQPAKNELTESADASSKRETPVPMIVSATAHRDSRASSNPCHSSEDSARDDLSNVRVLVVEDQPDALELYKIMLETYAAEVEIAASAPEAFEKVNQFQPHIILSDIGLPGENGYDLIRKIRALPAEKGGQTPAVAISAYTEMPYRTRALLAGFQLHVAKPIDLEEIVDIVHQLIGEAHSKTAQQSQRGEESP